MSYLDPRELLSFFSSKSWRLQRRIWDQNGKKDFSFEGKCFFTQFSSHYLYEESGDLTLNEKLYSSQRNYLYKMKDKNVEVSFEDGRFFYAIDCSLLPAISFQHHCGHDDYAGQLFLSPSQWRMSWTVKGPKKDFIIQSEYS